MGVAWVAGTTRAGALARRRAGVAAARRIAAGPDLATATRELAATPYGHDVREGHDLAAAEHAVAATLLWHLRVLAGWLPGRGGATLRALAGWFEIANVDALLLGGPPPGRGRPSEDDRFPEPLFEPGALATAWPALHRAGTARGEARGRAVRAALAGSPWGDPGGDDLRSIQLGMRLSWARRVAAAAPAARPWAAGALALLLARERFLERRPLSAGADSRRPPPAGPVWVAAAEAANLTVLARRLPPDAAWALRGVGTADELWTAEGRWWARLDRDGRDLLSRGGYGSGAALGAVAVLASDARRVRAALEMAARGGRPLEAFDAFVA